MFRSFVKFLQAYSILIEVVMAAGIAIGILLTIAESKPRLSHLQTPATMIRPYILDTEPHCRGNSGEPIAVPYHYWHEIGV